MRTRWAWELRILVGTVARAVRLLLALGGCTALACSDPAAASPSTAVTVATTTPSPEDAELRRCEAMRAEIEAAAPLPGAPEFEAKRGEILGRARGEPLLWIREPRSTPEDELSERARAIRASVARRPAFGRVAALLRALGQDRPALRALLLREGYLYSADPDEALALASRVKLVALFDEPELWLSRGERALHLRRTRGRDPEYRHVDGPDVGRAAELLLGDRVATSPAGLAAPLHRDLRALMEREGADRIMVDRISEHRLLLRLRYADAWARAVVSARGATLKLDCLLAPANERAAVHTWQEADAWRPRAIAALRRAVDAAVREGLPFDRPRGEESAELDGQLRPEWRWAYHAGQDTFTHDGKVYPVYDALGRPAPPEMCVDFVIESFERASGTWFRGRGERPGRSEGALDLDQHGIENRHAVLAFEKFAQQSPELFSHRRFAGDERTRFQERARFFRFLVEHADLFRAGDIVAIQGKKADGLVHQHAILVEATDPITGMPYALADQMKRPRRRTWEGIMAEAPLRSLLYRVRPSDALLARLDAVARRVPVENSPR